MASGQGKEFLQIRHDFLGKGGLPFVHAEYDAGDAEVGVHGLANEADGFQEFSMFARMRTSADLVNAHLILKDALSVEEQHVFMPHASLVYGDFDMVVREKLAHEIKLKSKNFTAEKITIVRANSRDPKEWNIVEQVSIQ